jgi:hypothetical protein
MNMTRQPVIPRRRFPLRILFVLSAATLLIENFVDYPLGIPRFKRLAGGLSLLDLRFWYTSQAVDDLFKALGEQGRRAYLQLLWTIDVWLPLICAMFLAEVIFRGRFQWLSWFPALVAACDYAENSVITVLLCYYPTQLPFLVTFCASLTLMKFIGYFLAIVIAIVGFFEQKEIDANGRGEDT